MKKISFWWVILALMVFTSGPARAQDAATQQQLDKLSGQIQDLLDAQALQGKRLDALEKEVSDLGNKVNQPAAGDGASAGLAARARRGHDRRYPESPLQASGAADSNPPFP